MYQNLKDIYYVFFKTTSTTKDYSHQLKGTEYLSMKVYQAGI